MMNKEQKKNYITEMTAQFENSKAVMVIHYQDLKTAISNAKSGQAESRNDKDGNIGVSIGKKSFNDDQLVKNFNAVLDTLEKEKSNNTVKGDLIKSAFITSTMGVSYKLKLGKNI